MTKRSKEDDEYIAKQMEQMAGQLQETRLEFQDWLCMECEGHPRFTHGEFVKHLADVHQIDIKTAKGVQSMKLHMDGKQWYQANYTVTIDGLQFERHVRNKRNKHTRIY